MQIYTCSTHNLPSSDRGFSQKRIHRARDFHHVLSPFIASGMETDSWDNLKWDEVLRKHRILVGTPEPLRRAMDSGFL